MTAFGRLDVFYADGRSASYPLEGAEISVGSDESNAIRLADEAVSPQHCLLQHQAGAAFITDLDSERGTYIDGDRLPANMPHQLRDIEEIQIGSVTARFYLRSDSPTEAIQAISDQTQPLSIGFRAELEQPTVSVWPASTAEVRLSISNLTDQRCGFLLEATGLPSNWVNPDQMDFWLAADETYPVSLQIKPSRRADMPPDNYPLTITVTRLGETEGLVRLVLMVELGGFGGLSLALDPPFITDSGAFKLHLLNQGNEELRLKLAAHEPASQLEIILAQDALRLGPGGRTQVHGAVRPRHRQVLGSPVIRPFALLTTNDDPSGYCVALPGYLTVKPYMSKRSLIAVLLVSVALAVVLATVLLQPPEPVISRFSLSESRVAQGTPVMLSWEASDAFHYVIEVDRVPLAELSSLDSSYSLVTNPFVDPVEIALIAVQGEHTAIAKWQLDIYQPVIVEQFDSDKTMMLRNVRGTLTVRWEVSGAVELDITNPLGFETVAKNTFTAGHGQIVLRGMPADEFKIELSALDEIGAITARTIHIAIREPECTPRIDATMYAGPDSRFPRRQIAIQNVPVLASGTTADREWLLIELASGESGWGYHSSFFCQGFDPSALKVITDLPELPTVTPTQQPTATPTNTATTAETPWITVTSTSTAPTPTPQV